MIEEFVQIPGPTFLMLFVGLVTVTITICRLWMRADGSYKYQLPDLTRFDSIGIAQLRGEKSLIMQTAIFRLYCPELIFFGGEEWDPEMTIRHRKRNISQLSGAAENEIYQYLRSGREKFRRSAGIPVCGTESLRILILYRVIWNSCTLPGQNLTAGGSGRSLRWRVL